MAYSFSKAAHMLVRECPTWTPNRLADRLLAEMPSEAREAVLGELVLRATRGIHHQHLRRLVTGSSSPPPARDASPASPGDSASTPAPARHAS